MLTLAISMVLYGVLVKTSALGGSDGFNVSRPTLFGVQIPAENGELRALCACTSSVVGVLATAARIYSDSVRGLVSLAIRENELRVEYLGASVTGAIAVNFVFAAFLGGVGGALTLLALGHIEPGFSYWTTSGEFVFIAILAGHHSMLAVFAASLAVELVRSFSNLYFPHTWQLGMGVFLLLMIRFLPRGLGSLWADRRARRPPGAAAAAACHASVRRTPARGLAKSFGAVTAADDVRHRHRAGERVSLIGSNGAGKTTFVNMVTGYLKPDAGTDHAARARHHPARRRGGSRGWAWPAPSRFRSSRTT